MHAIPARRRAGSFPMWRDASNSYDDTVTANAQPARENAGNGHEGREYFLLRNCPDLQNDAEHRLLELLVSLEDQDIQPSRAYLAYRFNWSIAKVKDVILSLHRKRVIYFEGATNKRRIVIDWGYIEANLQKPWREFKDELQHTNSAHTRAKLNRNSAATVAELSTNSAATVAELSTNSATKSGQLGDYSIQTRRQNGSHIKEKGFKGYPPTPLHASRDGGSALSRASRRNARTSKAKGNGSGLLSDQAVQVLGLKYDIQAQPGESWDSFRSRVLSEDCRRRADD
jgi:hypothetical protein